MNNIISIDPGSKGFITFINSDGSRQFYGIKDGDMLDVCNVVNNYVKEKRAKKENVVCVMEEVHAIFGSSAKATFSFGEINGFIKGMMTAYSVPYTLVQPKKWQSEIWIDQDKVYSYKKKADGDTKRVIDTKGTSYNAARRLFPDIDLRRTDRCKNYDDNKVDSLLISEYARRKNI